MTIEEMKKILSKRYGIHSEEELIRAIKESEGINIGIFTGRPEKESQ